MYQAEELKVDFEELTEDENIVEYLNKLKKLKSEAETVNVSDVNTSFGGSGSSSGNSSG